MRARIGGTLVRARLEELLEGIVTVVQHEAVSCKCGWIGSGTLYSPCWGVLRDAMR